VRILLDAQLSHQIAQLLVERGHDAEAVTSRSDLADNTPDEQLLAIAHAEGRAMVTNNVKDFRPIAARRIASGQGHAGLILVSPNTPRTKAANAPLADALEHLVLANPDGLSDSERWI
jgi:predicted nuclease of predicted toxin-antitoxin system